MKYKMNWALNSELHLIYLKLVLVICLQNTTQKYKI